jgi:uroporphyrinogen decarboxylase|tara:strand:- start:1439 stop:2443 length:1005 start_codon:yes stop_codon:yes gene_type:complete
MKLITECIRNKTTNINPVWLMRQAGRYLPEFREIRLKNQDFIKLCLNESLSSEITLQPIKRFDFDAAIIFSDILMLPYGLGQKVEFKKNFGPLLGDLDLPKLSQVDENTFVKKLIPVYDAIKNVKQNSLSKNKDVIGFVGAPWTLLVYMLNKQSPKKQLNNEILKDKKKVQDLFNLIDIFLKIHIKKQIESGASVIQIFDSWAGLVDHNDIDNYIYEPTIKLVDYVKTLNTPVICFPRNINDYKNYVDVIKPDVINIDYNVDPVKIKNQLDIVVQGGMDPKILLKDKDELKKEVLKFLNLFKDHPYIFNLGHGVLPETNPDSVDYMVKLIRDFK